nr:sarcosine oxidase subunit gamma family protein [Actibacterium sp. 188UL27-1]
MVAQMPLDGLDVSLGDARLVEMDLGPVTLLSAGQDSDLAQALQAAHGLSWPAPGGVVEQGEARILWFGLGQALLIGIVPNPSLGDHAALTDQSDAWAAMALSGPNARSVLVRLTPLDLRDGAFAVGRTARTMLQHMGCSLTRTGADAYLILVMRSMAASAAHDLTDAMAMVAARQTT